jgi:hypothetical protein
MPAIQYLNVIKPTISGGRQSVAIAPNTCMTKCSVAIEVVVVVVFDGARRAWQSRQPSCKVKFRLMIDQEGHTTMTTLELKLNLPDRLAQDAAQMGLLNADSLQTLLREAVRSRRIAQLAIARQRVAEGGVTPLSLDEIQAEVDQARAERRGQAKG